jgi:hypothetical protein
MKIEWSESLPDKSGTSCYHLVVTRLMTATGLLRVVPTSYKPIIYTGCSWQVASNFCVAINLLTTCYVQTISDLLEQLVASLLASSTLLQDDSNLFQTCQQLGTSSANARLLANRRFFRHPVERLFNNVDIRCTTSYTQSLCAEALGTMLIQ